MSLYQASIPQLDKMLQNLDRWLEAAVAHAKAKSFDPAVLLAARLAPDQYPLLRQIQSASDAAKLAVARLTGKDAPKHADGDQSIDELRARIAEVRAYFTTVSATDFEGASAREVLLPFLGGKVILGRDYFNEMALPNFYFHVTTAYSILRHNGVALGKQDFIGSLTTHDR